jgi:hypothetical protein
MDFSEICQCIVMGLLVITMIVVIVFSSVATYSFYLDLVKNKNCPPQTSTTLFRFARNGND